VAKKRKGGKRGPARKAADRLRAAYRAGLRRGQALASLYASPVYREYVESRQPPTTKRAHAAYISGIYAGKRMGPTELGREVPGEATPFAVDELVLYEAPVEEGVPILSGLDFAEWVKPTGWVVAVELWIEGQRVAEDDVELAAEWDKEPAAKSIRREVRAWYEDQISKHPMWRESPAATLVRLSLRRT
jgi:hypothetical protein